MLHWPTLSRNPTLVLFRRSECTLRSPSIDCINPLAHMRHVNTGRWCTRSLNTEIQWGPLDVVLWEAIQFVLAGTLFVQTNVRLWLSLNCFARQMLISVLCSVVNLKSGRISALWSFYSSPRGSQELQRWVQGQKANPVNLERDNATGKIQVQIYIYIDRESISHKRTLRCRKGNAMKLPQKYVISVKKRQSGRVVLCSRWKASRANNSYCQTLHMKDWRWKLVEWSSPPSVEKHAAASNLRFDVMRNLSFMS